MTKQVAMNILREVEDGLERAVDGMGEEKVSKQEMGRLVLFHKHFDDLVFSHKYFQEHMKLLFGGDDLSKFSCASPDHQLQWHELLLAAMPVTVPQSMLPCLAQMLERDPEIRSSSEEALH